MKEIKFRYVCYNKYFQELSLEYLTDDILREHDYVPSWILSDNCEIKDKQLCTGLKDKNSKDIYEGDIVDCSRYSEPPEIYRVIVKDIRYLPQEMFGSNLNWLEVVGNIYKILEHNNKNHR